MTVIKERTIKPYVGAATMERGTIERIGGVISTAKTTTLTTQSKRKPNEYTEGI